MSFDPRHSISVTGTGTIAAVPDVARLRIALERTAPVVGDALRATAEDVQQATAAARELGLDDRDIASGRLDLSQVYGESVSDVRGFQVSQAMTFTVRDLPVVGRLVTRLAEVAGGGLRIHGMGLEVGEREPLLRQARELAMTAAREQAEALARLAGRGLGEVLVIGADAASAPLEAMPKTRMMAASFTPEAGEQELSAAVTVTFALV